MLERECVTPPLTSCVAEPLHGENKDRHLSAGAGKRRNQLMTTKASCWAPAGGRIGREDSAVGSLTLPSRSFKEAEQGLWL